MHDNIERKLRKMALNIRLDILDMVEQAGSGHIDSAFSCVEIVTMLFGQVMHHDVKHPDAVDRDRFILSKGHAGPALYAILARHGYFDRTELLTLRQLHSRLQGHPKRGLPGIEVNTGSLGQGLSIAAGLALGLSRQHPKHTPQVFSLLSDGELNEGQVWEALMFAGHQHIGNLVAIVDGNGLQYSGATKDVSNLSGFGVAVAALGWNYREVDGHSMNELQQALQKTPHSDKPLLVFAHTAKGRGGLFLENDLAWHGKVPTASEITTVREHLQKELSELVDA